MRHTVALLALHVLILTCAATLLTDCPRRTQASRAPMAQTASRPSADVQTPPGQGSRKVPAPPAGCLYHGIHPGGEGGEEDAVLSEPALIDSYARAVGHQPAFVYFSHEWGHSNDREEDAAAHAFPLEAVRRIASGGRVPFVRLMLRTSSDEACKKPEKYFLLENILGTRPDGTKSDDPKHKKITEEINADLREWGRVARELYKGPLIVEWGTEANNLTFHWNPQCRPGADKKAAVALFRRAFRHIVRMVTGPEPEKSNIVWVFHVTASDDPDPSVAGNEWNRMADYYPDGTAEDPVDVVDWLGVSVYGADNLDTGACGTFSEQLKGALGDGEGKGEGERLLALSRRTTGRQKPIFVLEFGTALNYHKSRIRLKHCEPDAWIGEAFKEIFTRSARGEIAGFSWWNERFEGEGPSRRTLEMRLDHLRERGINREAILKAYNSQLNNPRVAHGAVEVGSQSNCKILR